MTLTCDTSVLVAALLTWHPAHDDCVRAVGEVAEVPVHVLTETYSVLTRLPPEHRVAPAVAALAISTLPWTPFALEPGRARDLIGDLAPAGISGGAVYDALIAATAAERGLTLLTRDLRATRTYRALDIAYRTM